MSDLPETTIVEGEVLFRDKRKWRPRFCVIRRIDSAQVVDRLQMLLYADAAARRSKKTSEIFSLDEFCGLEVGQLLEGEQHTLSIITTEVTYSIALKSTEVMDQWTHGLRRECGDEWGFEVKVLPTKKKIRSGEATLRFFPAFFSITAGSPPQCIGFWMHNQLRRYGGSSGFSFEAGSKCRGGEGVYKLETEQGSSIKELFDRVANGRRLPDPSYRTHSHSHSRLTPSLDPDFQPARSRSRSPAAAPCVSPSRRSANFSDLPPSDTFPLDRQPRPPVISSDERPRLSISSDGSSTNSVEYQNVAHIGSDLNDKSSAYTYVNSHRSPLCVVDDVNYVQIDHDKLRSDESLPSGPLSPHSTASRFETAYTQVDPKRTAKLTEALKTQSHLRSRPV